MIKKNTDRFFHSRMTLAEGVQVRNQVDFPMNRLISAIYLRISATVTVGGGTPASYVAVTNPILALIQNIMFKVSGDGIAINAPGYALYQYAAYKLKKLPRIDNASFNPNSKAAYAMSVSIPLLFSDPLAFRPEDTILDLSRYSSAELHILMGAAAGVHTTSVGSDGTFTLSAMTCDIEIEGPSGAPRASMRPKAFQRIELEGGPKNAASDTSVLLTRASDRALKRIMIGTFTDGNISKPFLGTASSAIISTLSFSDEQDYYDRDRRDEAILDDNQISSQVDAQTGVYILDYVKDKSNLSAIPTGDKGKLELAYVVDAGAPATINTVSTVSETINKLK